MHKPNNLLESDVRDELDWDPRLDDGRIVVKADDGQVTLTGAVGSYAEWLEASDATRSIGGVHTVDNELVVGRLGEQIADIDIAADCAAALDADRFVPHGAVTAAVADGLVTLSGEVRHHFQRLAAEHAVYKVDGVGAVTDNIVITPEPIPSDVADRINKAFRRSAMLDDSMIEVSSAGNTISLDGAVRSWAAREEAEETAWKAPGVAEVIDRLVIAP
jgi:osmotically-inducible protein OsmY